jgi:hypothetical protein
MAQFDAIRYSPLGNTKVWTSSRCKGRQAFALTSLILVAVIIFRISFGAYKEHVSRIAEERPFNLPSLSRITTTSTVTVTSRPTPTENQKLNLEDWSFDSQRDSNNYGLSASQCGAAFKPLFEEITRASKYTQENDWISPSDLDISWTKEGAVRVLIQDGQVSLKRNQALPQNLKLNTNITCSALHRLSFRTKI